jgi:ketosteroid isomerase-like protein
MGAHAETARAVYEAFARGDVAAVLAAFDDQIEWQEPAGLPFESQVGPQAVAEKVFGPVLSQMPDFRIEVRELVEGDDVVCSIGSYHGTGAATGIELEADFVHVLRFSEDGKLRRFRTYTDTHLWRQALGVRD